MNVSMTIAMAGIYITSIGDLDTVLGTSFGVPFIQVLYDATHSRAGTSVMASIVIIQMISACISEGACASRQIWSFARDHGLPGSRWLAKVSDGFNIPVNAIMTSVVIVAALACINIGSTTALNAINSLGGISLLATYLIVVGCYIWHRLNHGKPPRGEWSPYGLYIAIAGCVMVLPVFFFLLWPLYPHPDAVNM